MTPASIIYLPPPSFQQDIAKTMLNNLMAFPTRYPLLVYSDHDYSQQIKGANIHFIKLKLPPEVAKLVDTNHKNYKWIVNNSIFLTGVALARLHNYSHIIYLESDCRVGRQEWDDVMFDEYFNIPHPVICAGSLVVWNPSNSGMDAQIRWQQLVAKNTRRNFPIPTYGYLGSALTGPSAVFPNGALGVYDMAWLNILLADCYSKKGINNSALIEMHAWDFHLGREIWKRFEHKAYDLVEHMATAFSTYGNVLTTEAERLDMLRQGRVVAIHQIKSAATI